MEDILNCADYLLNDEDTDVFFDATEIPIISEEDVVVTKTGGNGDNGSDEQTHYIASQDSFPIQKTEPSKPRPFRGRRKGTGPSTGLRAVTHSVYNILKSRAVTTYEDISKWVIEELEANGKAETRNVRRRAYDVINVMSAVGAIVKVKKQVFNVDLLSNNEVSELIEKREMTLKRIREKERKLIRLHSKEQMVEVVQSETVCEVVSEEELQPNEGDQENQVPMQ